MSCYDISIGVHTPQSVEVRLRKKGIRLVKLINLIVVAVSSVMAFSSGAETVDPAAFGLSPDAEPGVNVAAMRKALTGGKRTVKVSKRGVYRVDDSIFFDDDTELECVPGVVFQRTRKYPNMFVNRAAYEGGVNRNITIRNLEVSVNGFEELPGLETKCFGLRGNVAFFHVKNVKVLGYVCRDMEARCYAIHFSDFDGFVLDGFEILGKKDGVHLNGGKNFVIRNGVLRTGDDGIALNASDWPSSAPFIGTIENGLVENIVDLEGGTCNFVRVLTGAVPEWHEGIVVRRGEPIRVGNRIYFVQGPVSKQEYVSRTMPQHTQGTWTSPEGVSFLYLQDDGCRTMDIRNVVFRNLTMGAKRGFLCYMDDNAWARSLHPEVPDADVPHAQITVENVMMTTGYPLINGCGNLDVTLKNVFRVQAAPLVSMGSFNGRPVVQCIRVSGLTCPEKGDDFVFRGAGIDAKVVLESVGATRNPVLKSVGGAKAVLEPVR